MSNKDYRELQLSSSQLILIFVAILVLGLVSFYFTDVFSGGVFQGVVLPIVDVVFVIYLMMLFVGMKYRSKTDDSERSIELFQASNDGE